MLYDKIYYNIYYIILYYIILYYIILYYIILYCIILYYIILYYIILYYIILYYIMFYYIIYIILYYVFVLYCIVSYYCIIVSYFILYYTILYHTILRGASLLVVALGACRLHYDHGVLHLQAKVFEAVWILPLLRSDVRARFRLDVPVFGFVAIAGHSSTGKPSKSVKQGHLRHSPAIR